MCQQTAPGRIGSPRQKGRPKRHPAMPLCRYAAMGLTLVHRSMPNRWNFAAKPRFRRFTSAEEMSEA